jgi:hypothetical protein
MLVLRHEVGGLRRTNPTPRLDNGVATNSRWIDTSLFQHGAGHTKA